MADPFFRVAAQLVQDQGVLLKLQLPSLRLFLLLASMADRQTGQCFPSWAYLTANTGMSRRTIARGMKQLRRYCLVEVIAEGGHGGGSSVYEVRNVRQLTTKRRQDTQLSLWELGANSGTQNPELGANSGTHNKSQVFNHNNTAPLGELDEVAVGRLVRVARFQQDPARRLVAKYGYARVNRAMDLFRQAKGVKRPAAWVTAVCRDDYSHEMPPSAGHPGKERPQGLTGRQRQSTPVPMVGVVEGVKRPAQNAEVSPQWRMNTLQAKYPSVFGGTDAGE